jgi:hypothetical protein
MYVHIHTRTYVRTQGLPMQSPTDGLSMRSLLPEIPGPSNSLRAAATGTATVPKVTVTVTVTAKVTVVANVTPTAMVIYG